MKVAVLAGFIIFTFHNLKGKNDLKVIFLRLCHYTESNSNQHLLNSLYVPDTVVLFHRLFCLILTAALSSEYGYLVEVAEVSGPRSHRA